MSRKHNINDSKFIPRKGPKKRKDPLAEIAGDLIDHIKTSMFAKWLLPVLRKHYGDESSSFEQLVDRAANQAPRLQVEEETGMDLDESQFPIQYYMLTNEDNVVISGMQITHEQILYELEQLQALATKEVEETTGTSIIPIETVVIEEGEDVPGQDAGATYTSND